MADIAPLSGNNAERFNRLYVSGDKRAHHHARLLLINIWLYQDREVDFKSRPEWALVEYGIQKRKSH